MTYLAVKQAHLILVSLSLVGFLLRGWWMWRRPEILQHRLTRTLPHINDTLLLCAGIWLAYLLRQYPGNSAWLTAKLIALLVYIVLGSVALKRGKTFRTRVFAFIGALTVFGYMVLVAWFHTPWPFPRFM